MIYGVVLGVGVIGLLFIFIAGEKLNTEEREERMTQSEATLFLLVGAPGCLLVLLSACVALALMPLLF